MLRDRNRREKSYVVSHLKGPISVSLMKGQQRTWRRGSWRNDRRNHLKGKTCIQTEKVDWEPPMMNNNNSNKNKGHT